MVYGGRPTRLTAWTNPEQLPVGHRHRQHDIGEQRVYDDHVVERVPLVFGDIVQLEDCVERKDQPVMRPRSVDPTGPAGAPATCGVRREDQRTWSARAARGL